MSETVNRFEKSLSIARRILPFMGTNGIPATPDNYMIFYVYHQGDSEFVKAAVDAHLNSGRQWSEDSTSTLFRQLFGPEANLELFQMNERMASQIKDMTQNLIEETRVTTRQTDKTSRILKETIQEADQSLELSETAELLKALFGEFNRIQGRFEDYSGSLKDSSSRLDGIIESLNRLEEAALTDELTRLANRRGWERRLETEFKRFKRYSHKTSLVLLDIDDFKKFNDSFGHLVGDQALREVARVVSGCIREVDLAARYGGEEFTALLPDTDLKGGAVVAERMRTALAATSFTVKGRPIPLTASFGVAEFRPQDEAPTDSLDRADKALYLAKEKGKNRVCLETQIRS